MVKLNLRSKFIILILVLMATGWLLTQPVVNLRKDKTYFAAPSRQLSEKEIYDFLVLWNKFHKSSLKENMGQRSLRKKEDYPWAVVKWFEIHNWSAERFFHDEQRIRDISSCMILKENLETNILINEKVGTNLQDIIDAQKQGLRGCVFSEEEIAGVKNNEEYIKNFLLNNDKEEKEK